MTLLNCAAWAAGAEAAAKAESSSAGRSLLFVLMIASGGGGGARYLPTSGAPRPPAVRTGRGPASGDELGPRAGPAKGGHGRRRGLPGTLLLDAVVGHAEVRDGLGEEGRLLLEARGGGGELAHERGVLLRHLVHLHDGAVHLLDSGALLAGGRRDLAHRVRHPRDGAQDRGHRAPGLVGEPRAVRHLL